MSDAKRDSDPSMDDILASIRKIISDDEARAQVSSAAGAPAEPDRKSTRLNSSHSQQSRMPSSA